MATTKRQATVEDLTNAPDDGYKYELVDGELKRMPPTGEVPGGVAFVIAIALDRYAQQTGHGVTHADGPAYLVDLPHRKSFSPDASLVAAYDEKNMGFIGSAPIFAVEVRSQSDYGPAANREYAAKRADYFAAGTEVVWDVDPLARTVTKYVNGVDVSVTFGVDEQADAEPALPGWRVAVAHLFGRRTTR